MTFSFIALVRYAKWLEQVGMVELLEALGIVRVVTTALSSMHLGYGDPTQDAPINLYWAFLSHLVRRTPGCRLLPESLNAGLLETIISHAELCPAEDDTVKYLVDFVRIILPGALILYPVVNTLRPALARVVQTPYSHSFSTWPAFWRWGKFVALAKERLEILDHLHSTEYVRRRACDNPMCNVIAHSTALKRCGGCLREYYCSTECQRFRWTQRRHREQCSSAKQRHESIDMTRRADAFLRLILHHDYVEHKCLILRRQLEWLRVRPYTGSCTVFDYRFGRCRIAVHALGYKKRDGCEPIIGCEMHIALVGNARGQPISLRSYILRADSSVLVDGLMRIADMIPDGIPRGLCIPRSQRQLVMREIRLLAKSEVVEMHWD
ncbi:hypothetical protein C8R43DRAFT_1137963 [Mycena crocata]|nr:hypothetical protein C8R43DRAFT_1137963 [Mycena crocata]